MLIRVGGLRLRLRHFVTHYNHLTSLWWFCVFHRINDSVREFGFELYGKVKQLNTGRMGQHTRPSQPSTPTRAELEKQSREYRLVMSDDEEEDKKGGGRKGKEIKFLKDKAARKMERRERRRSRKRDKESESDDDNTMVVHRRLKREEDSELVEETEEAKKEVNQSSNSLYMGDMASLCHFWF